jgi:uncharacterized protein (TIGR02757 family)
VYLTIIGCLKKSATFAPLKTNMHDTGLKDRLDDLVDRVNRLDFIENDPIGIPHRFTSKQDIEISGFLAAILAWGQRKTIINKTNELISMMDNDPYRFIVGHSEEDRKPFVNFVHRTFQGADALYFLEFLQQHYRRFESLEQAFVPNLSTVYRQEDALNHFYQYFSASPHLLQRTLKHIASPAKKSTCKRLNMFLRWMVRSDDRGVDFGIWKSIPMSGLMIPLDVHVEKYSRQFGLLKRKQRDWLAVTELTTSLAMFDEADPVKYDFALFGLGVMKD